MLADAHEQRLRDDQRERHLEGEAGADSLPRFDLDLAVQRVEIGANHVETDSASGQLRLSRSGREAREEHEVEQFLRRERACLFGVHQLEFGGGRANLLVIDAAAVVLHLDKNVIAAVIGANRDIAAVRFAGIVTLVRPLDAVRHGIAHQVQQRIGNLLDDVVVQLGLGARQHQFHPLAGRLGGVAHGPRETRVEVADRHHARLRDLILQTVRQLGELIDVAIDAAHEAIELREHLGNVGGNFRERTRQDAEVVVAIHLQLGEVGERGIEGTRIARVAPAERIRNQVARFLVRQRRTARQAVPGSGERPQGHAAEFVFLLEFADLVGHARLGKIQHVGQPLQLFQPAQHTGPIRHQLANRVHHAVQPLQGNADRLGLRHSGGLAPAGGQGGDFFALVARDVRLNFRDWARPRFPPQAPAEPALRRPMPFSAASSASCSRISASTSSS